MVRGIGYVVVHMKKDNVEDNCEMAIAIENTFSRLLGQLLSKCKFRGSRGKDNAEVVDLEECPLKDT